MRNNKSVANAARPIYELLKSQLEAAHPNRFVAIEPSSGEYFISDTLSDAIGQSRKKYPDRLVHTFRIGHTATVHFGMQTAMKGIVDDSGRAILPIQIFCGKHPLGVEVDTWIDTGFTGDLVLPESVVEELELEVTGSIDGILADGSQIELATHHCQLSWFGRIRDLEVIANTGQMPLLGVGLLLAKELRVDYVNLELSLDLVANRK